MTMTQTETGGRNVLAELDRRVPTRFYWQLTLLACLGGFLFGYDTSNIGSALNFVPYHLSSFWTGYLVAGASLGAAAGALCAGPLDRPVRPEGAAHHRRADLRGRRDPVRGHPGRRAYCCSPGP